LFSCSCIVPLSILARESYRSFTSEVLAYR
jgi:hypothetical protein